MSLIPITPQSPIPPDLKEKFSTPQIPWAISQVLFKRITEQSTPTHQRFKKCSLVSSDPEHAFLMAMPYVKQAILSNLEYGSKKIPIASQKAIAREKPYSTQQLQAINFTSYSGCTPKNPLC
jgi:hypothetical protein